MILLSVASIASRHACVTSKAVNCPDSILDIISTAENIQNLTFLHVLNSLFFWISSHSCLRVLLNKIILDGNGLIRKYPQEAGRYE